MVTEVDDGELVCPDTAFMELVEESCLGWFTEAC